MKAAMQSAPFCQRPKSVTRNPAGRPAIASKPNERALTRLELLVMLATLTLLMLVAIPLLANPAIATQRAVCANNLRQISQAFRNYAVQNDDRFPWTGTNAPITTYYIAAQAEIGTPRILVCPSDTKRTVANNFSNGVFVAAAHLSYALNRQARINQAGNWMLSDQNIIGKGLITSGSNVDWRAVDNHGVEGNVATVDGRVEQLTIAGLRNFVNRALTNQYAIEIIGP